MDEVRRQRIKKYEETLKKLEAEEIRMDRECSAYESHQAELEKLE
jgi:hypothetical protein